MPCDIIKRYIAAVLGFVLIAVFCFNLAGCSRANADVPESAGQENWNGDEAETVLDKAGNENLPQGDCDAGGDGAGNPVQQDISNVSGPAKQDISKTGGADAPHTVRVEAADPLAGFMMDLFKRSYQQEPGENTLISPLSVILALSMTANGADNQTLSQMEKVLGLPIGQLNEQLYDYAKKLPSDEKCRLGIGNSIWFRPEVAVKEEFLQNNNRYYGAEVYKREFNDQAVEEINGWVKQKTDGLIDNVIDKIDNDTAMFLINAVIFDAKWKREYDKADIYTDEFNGAGGKKQVEFMASEESKFLEDGKATGFIKPYAGGYSFVALLPNEGVSIDEYIGGLEGSEFINIIRSAQPARVAAYMPKFDYEYSIEMNGILQDLGMVDAFSPLRADFSRIADLNELERLFINSVFHKTRITVDELGTKAGAVTAVIMKTTAVDETPIKIVKLDRPFVFAIVDNETYRPVFIGAVLDPQ